MSRHPSYLLVVGTDTGVGKTVATAALAVRHRAAGRSVAMVKPVQTGLQTGEPGDVDVVRELAGVQDAYELVRLAEPLAPESAARRSGAELPPVAELSRRIAATTAGADLVLVEGIGGVTVRLDPDGGTVLDLGRALQWHGDVQAVVVVRAGLGTLNHTALTIGAVSRADLTVTGLVLGSWPAEPDLAATVNRTDLPRLTGCPVRAAIPAGAGRLGAADFQRQVATWCVRPSG